MDIIWRVVQTAYLAVIAIGIVILLIGNAAIFIVSSRSRILKRSSAGLRPTAPQ